MRKILVTVLLLSSSIVLAQRPACSFDDVYNAIQFTEEEVKSRIFCGPNATLDEIHATQAYAEIGTELAKAQVAIKCTNGDLHLGDFYLYAEDCRGNYYSTIKSGLVFKK